MGRRVTAKDGLRIAGVKIANEGSVISNEFYETHATANGWEKLVEEVSDETKSEAKADTTPDRRIGEGNQVETTVTPTPKNPAPPKAPTQ